MRRLDVFECDRSHAGQSCGKKATAPMAYRWRAGESPRWRPEPSHASAQLLSLDLWFGTPRRCVPTVSDRDNACPSNCRSAVERAANGLGELFLIERLRQKEDTIPRLLGVDRFVEVTGDKD